ncbi:hypothetical protein EP47_04945 [Legionella norrlandica]|uniref:Flagellar hook-associated protein 2 n=1 Tax=Legionella norrlandica TaxID=1498499 RepID=A0A0A2T8F1_9GAMM|nr:flagellar filament capping protein FliD [Legionella norrlandica]KGP63713.1 hypothetical protein EP47_04945 [Legionella norrlandica]
MANGISSGLDITSIVDGLMEVEKIGLKRLEQKNSLYQKQLSSYTQLKNLIKNLSDSISKFDTVLKQNFYKASSNNELVATALLNTNNPTPGNFNLNVSQLATAHQIGSTIYSSKDQSLNLSGMMVLTQGSNSYNISIKDSDSLENIRDTINSSLGNIGIRASILHTNDASDQDQYILLLSATNTGAINQINVSGDNPLQINNVLQAAQDAQFSINNYSVTRSTNIINDVLEGVTFQLNQTGVATISVNPDTSNQVNLIAGALSDFIKAYNQVMEELAKDQSLRYLRDSTYPLIIKNLQEIMTQTIGTNPINSLLDMGIKLAKAEVKTNDEGVEYVVKGKLDINHDLLSENIEQNLPQLRAFFSNSGANFDAKVLTSLTTLQTGTIYNREQIISQERNLLSKKINSEQGRLDVVRTNLTLKYAALDNIISKYQQLGNFIEQQITMFNKQKK